MECDTKKTFFFKLLGFFFRKGMNITVQMWGKQWLKQAQNCSLKGGFPSLGRTRLIPLWWGFLSRLISRYLQVAARPHQDGSRFNGLQFIVPDGPRAAGRCSSAEAFWKGDKESGCDFSIYLQQSFVSLNWQWMKWIVPTWVFNFMIANKTKANSNPPCDVGATWQ